MNLFAPKHTPSLIIILMSALSLAACGEGSNHTEEADSIYFGGDIITLDDTKPSVQSLALKDGKILAIGDYQALEDQHKGSKTRIIHLGGKSLLPAFIDAHSHYINSLLVANQVNLTAPPSGPGKNVESIIAQLKKFAVTKKIPKRKLIIGYGYDDTIMPNGRLLNRDDLDKAFPNNPVRVDHVSMHGTVMNSLALKKYGITSDTATPLGGIIVRKPGTNEPYGLIMETAFLPIVEKVDPMTADQEINWSKAGQMLYAQSGITTAHEGMTQFTHLETLKRVADAKENIIDIVAYPFILDLDKILMKYPSSEWRRYNNHLKIAGVKMTIDGSPQGKTAYFSKPYLNGGPGGEKDWVGEPTFPQQTVNGMVKKVYDLGLPLNLHANGDAAIDMFFKAHEFAADDDPRKNRNVTLMHAQFTRKDQILKYAEYKIRPSFYTLHTYYFAEAHMANRGLEQTMYISPMRDAIDAGLHPTNHTDFVVAPLDQMFMLWTAVNRISRGGAEIGYDQRVTPLEGLKAMTIWAAEQYGEENEKGSLAPGKLADLVILDKNPLKVDPMEIKNRKVIETIKEGKTIFIKSSKK